MVKLLCALLLILSGGWPNVAILDPAVGDGSIVATPTPTPSASQHAWFNFNPTYTAQNKDVSPILAGQAVAGHPSGAGVVLARADDPNKLAVGIATADINPGFSGTIQPFNNVDLPDWTAATGSAALLPNAVYYLSDTPGMLTTLPPSIGGHVVQCIGKSSEGKLWLTISIQGVLL